MNRYSQRLEKLAKRYCSAERAVVGAFFNRPRVKKDHVGWLKAQAFKEYSAIKPLLATLTRLHPRLDSAVERHRFEELGEKLADETKHAGLIMDLLEEITGKKVSPRDLPWLPEDKRLARIRARYSKTYAGILHGSETLTTKEITRKDEDIERAALAFTEGGGGALYRVCRGLKKGKVEKRIASVFNEIYVDEVKHKDTGARDLGRLITRKGQYERAARIIREVSGQRLRMRNEQFGFPLSEHMLREMERKLEGHQAAL